MSIGRIRFTAVLAATLSLVIVSDVYAQRTGRGGEGRGGQGGQGGRGGQGFQGFGGQGFGGQGFGGGGFGGASPLDLVMREDVQKELEVLGDQVAELEKLRDGQRERMAQLFQGAAGGGRGRGGDANPEDRRAQLRDLLTTANRDLKAQIDGILLPHQSKRLDQLVIQFQMRGGGLTGVLRNDEVGDKLAITDAQIEDAQQKAEAIEADLRKKVAALRQEAQEKLMGQVLNASQREEFKRLVGDPFEFDESSRPAFGGGGRRGGGQ